MSQEESEDPPQQEPEEEYDILQMIAELAGGENANEIMPDIQALAQQRRKANGVPHSHATADGAPDPLSGFGSSFDLCYWRVPAW